MAGKHSPRGSYVRVSSSLFDGDCELVASAELGRPRTVRIAEEPRHVKEAVVIILHAGYLISGPGICRTVLMLMSLLAFLLISLFGDKAHHYLATEVAWKFRVYIFVAVLCCLSCAVLVFMNLASLHTMFRFDWNLIDCYQYALFMLAHLISSTILATAHRDSCLSASSKEKAVVATCWGYVCMVACATNACLAYRRRLLARQHRYKVRSGSIRSSRLATTNSPVTFTLSIGARRHNVYLQ